MVEGNDKSITIEASGDVYVDQSINNRHIPIKLERESIGLILLYFLKNPARIREWIVIIFLIFLMATGISIREMFDRFLPPAKKEVCKPIP